MKIKIFRQAWFKIAAGGIAFFIITEIVLVKTGDPLYFPTVILLGAFIVPVTFVTFFYEYVRDRDISTPLLTTCFIVGGMVGIIAAGSIEYSTLRSLNIVSLIEVGLTEEAVKLIFPVAMFIWWKYRHEADGLLFGVAAGMGFAALETMGYAMVELVRSGGSVGVLQQVLLVRGLLSPAGHAAWTGFVCAALWRQRQLTGHPLGLTVIGAYLAAVLLHTVWDLISSMKVQTNTQLVQYIVFLLVIMTVSLFLVFWRFRKVRKFALETKGAAK